MVNTLVYCEDQGDEAIALANRQQHLDAKEAKKKGISSLFSGKRVRQCYGPLRRFLIPEGHTRRSNRPLWKGYLKCEKSTRMVDMARIADALTVETGGCVAELLPLDLLIEGW